MSSVTPFANPDPRNQKRYYIKNTTTRRIVTAILRGLFWLFSDLRVYGVENLPPEGAVILVANHLTNFDVFPMQFVLPRLIFYMAKAELHQNKIMDAILRRLGAFPVYRGERDEWAFHHALQVLEQGQVLGMFPEGKRSGGMGLRAAKTGAARLAMAANCPVLPLAVNGTQRMLKRFSRRNLVTIHIGTPISPDEDTSPLEFTDRLMFALAAMLPPELRGVYAHKPEGL
jgi:1-acyl-sn-glycerol-3-phosphate acyltransferase